MNPSNSIMSVSDLLMVRSVALQLAQQALLSKERVFNQDRCLLMAEQYEEWLKRKWRY